MTTLATQAVLELSVGRKLLLDSVEWTVEAFEPQYGRVLLCRRDGTRFPTSVRFLMRHRGCRSFATEVPPASIGRQPKTLHDLPPQRLEQVELRVAHLLEVETGFRSGDRLRAEPGEPRAQYDPDTTTVTQRRLAKVDELKLLKQSDPEHARMLGLDHVGLRTLIRLESLRRRFGPVGCADDPLATPLR